MNVATIVLAMALSFTQTVTFSNCCRGLLCPQKDACPPCPEEDRPDSGKALAADQDCCGERNPVPADSSHGATCFHLEPSTDVEQAPAMEIAATPAADSGFLFAWTPEAPFGVPDPRPSITSARAPDPLREGSKPLRVLHLPLLI